MTLASPDGGVATPLRRVVYVVGSGHSGSTLLALLAHRHPEVASVGEASVKPAIRRAGRAAEQRCSCGERLDACPFWQRIFSRVTAAGTRFDATHWSNDYRFEQPWLDRLLTRETSVPGLRRARRWAARHLPGYRQRVARIGRVNVAFVDAVLAETGAVVFFDTTKLLTRLTHLLDLPALDLRVLWLTRDVRGYAYSATRRGLSARAAAWTWRCDQEAIGHALGQLAPDRRMHLRYEALCEEPAAVMRRVFSFCGVPPMEGIGGPQAHVLGNQMRASGTLQVALDARWRSGLDPEQRRLVEAVAGELNAKLGHG